jgi:RNA polymerase sigma-70 factor (sigma-E family)
MATGPDRAALLPSMLFNRQAGLQPDPGFEEFVRSRSTALLRTAFLLVGDRGHAEDLVQTALLRTALKWRKAQGKPEAYTHQVLVNLVRDRWRRSRRRVAEDPVAALPMAPADRRNLADAVVDRAVLMRALAELPPRQREVTILRFFADLSVADTAAAMRTSEGTVKSYTNRALAQLRESLGVPLTTNAMESNRA